MAQAPGRGRHAAGGRGECGERAARRGHRRRPHCVRVERAARLSMRWRCLGDVTVSLLSLSARAIERAGACVAPFEECEEESEVGRSF